jgi:hypothetical protein
MKAIRILFRLARRRAGAVLRGRRPNRPLPVEGRLPKDGKTRIATGKTAGHGPFDLGLQKDGHLFK